MGDERGRRRKKTGSQENEWVLLRTRRHAAAALNAVNSDVAVHVVLARTGFDSLDCVLSDLLERLHSPFLPRNVISHLLFHSVTIIILSCHL